MIKWGTDTQGRKYVEGYVCDNSTKAISGNPIIVYFPEDHIADTGVNGPLHFGSDKDLIEFMQKLITKFRPWKSKLTDKKVPPSSGARSIDKFSGPPKDENTGGGLI